MQTILRFDEVLDAVDKMPIEDQNTLIEVLEKRHIERRREELAKEIQQGQLEFQAGKISPKSPHDIMQEILP